MMDKSSTPLISIIVPVYNVEKYLQRCIDSILAQSFKDFELSSLTMEARISQARFVMRMQKGTQG